MQLNKPRDDLKIKTVAKYKLLSNKDLNKFANIENKKLPKPQIKGIALSSRSIEELDNAKVKDMFASINLSLEGSQDYKNWDETSEKYSERMEHKKLLKEEACITKIRKVAYRPDDSEKDNYIRSSLDFWEDIEPNMAKGNKMLDMSVPPLLALGEESNPNESKLTKKITVNNFDKGGIRIEDTKEYKAILKKLNGEKCEHQQQLKDIRDVAKQYTVNFFKEKCAKVQMQFNAENNRIYKDYDDVRKLHFKGQRKIITLYRYMNKQER